MLLMGCSSRANNMILQLITLFLSGKVGLLHLSIPNSDKERMLQLSWIVSYTYQF